MGNVKDFSLFSIVNLKGDKKDDKFYYVKIFEKLPL